MEYCFLEVENIDSDNIKIILGGKLSNGFIPYAHFIVPKTRYEELSFYLGGMVDFNYPHDYNGLKIVNEGKELFLPKEECRFLECGMHDNFANATLNGKLYRFCTPEDHAEMYAALADVGYDLRWIFEKDEEEEDDDYDYEYYCDFGDEDDYE